MQQPTAATVLGNFANATFDESGRHARFFQSGGRYRIETEGAAGGKAIFEVAYTFGVDPLQQYLLRLPGGRLQAFDIAWDSRVKAEGGQRWFALQTPAPKPDDALHWAGREHNWNFACAPCHSTGLRKNFDLAANTYNTTFDEMDVACAACHGDGTRHIKWAEGRLPPDAADAGPNKGFAISLRDENIPRFGATGPDRPIASRVAAGSGAAPEICFSCHARREALIDGPAPGTPFLDAYRPALLDEGLYDPDGRNHGEVFEYGAFEQSAMARAGVSCLNCHDAHSAKLKAEGNALCAQCHLPARFDTESHTHLASAACITCHMPERTYMGVHVRHDHGFRRPATPGFAAAIGAARNGAPADARLRAILDAGGLAGIVRATAASLLADPTSPQAASSLAKAAADPDPLVRMGVARAATNLTPEQKAALAPRLLSDPRRAVRVEAARALADLPETTLAPAAVPAWRQAIVEFLNAEAVNADRPEAHVELGDFWRRRGDPQAAAQEFATALRIAPDFEPALLDAADLDRESGDEAGAQSLLRKAAAIAPGDPLPLDALALSRLRQGHRDEASALLNQAGMLAPGDPRTAQLRVASLVEAGDPESARVVLDKALAAHPDNTLLLQLSTQVPPRTAQAASAARLHALADIDVP